MEDYRNYVLNHGASSIQQALQNGTKKWATFKGGDEDFLMQQTLQLENNNLLAFPPPSQIDEGCFVTSFTSDRSGKGSASNVEPALLSLGLSIELSSQMQKQQEEIKTLIKSQNKKLIKCVLEKRQSHLQDFFASAEQGISMMMLKEKDADLENLSHRNIQLQALMKQLTMEALMWQKVAKDYEVILGNLKSDLEKLEAQIGDQKICRGGSFDVDDAVSCCYYQQDHSILYDSGRLTMKEGGICKVCRMKSCCIVLLPCRHVCLCADCEKEVIACPLCNSFKSASIHAYMS